MKIRTKRHICLAVSMISFLIILGAAGGIETYLVNFKTGAIIMIVSLLVGIAATYKGGYLK